MLFRKSFPMWMCVILFIACITMMPLVSRLRHPPADVPHTIAELGASLSRCDPPLHMVWQREDCLEFGMWVCVRPQPRERLSELCRAPEHADRWQGIVFCERVGNRSLLILEEDIRNNWGEYGMRVGAFVLFGDPDLLRRISKVIVGEPDARAAAVKERLSHRSPTVAAGKEG